MSFPHLTASPPTPHAMPRSADHFAREITDLVDEIQRTRDWFNAQIEAQLSSLNQLRAAMQTEESAISASMATLFEAPHPVVSPAPEPALPPPHHKSASIKPEHQAIVLPPAHITAIDPELEQATLRELNDALSRAFSEISSRGGMLG